MLLLDFGSVRIIDNNTLPSVKALTERRTLLGTTAQKPSTILQRKIPEIKQKVSGTHTGAVFGCVFFQDRRNPATLGRTPVLINALPRRIGCK
jgi:hypothetical protein